MNYFAHIHLGELTQTSKLGNFLGDFVKGDLSKWSTSGANESINENIKFGIDLHRKIDVFTDSHPKIKSLRELFPDHLRRMSGIILDIYFDHLLSKNLLNSNAKSTLLMLDDFYYELESTDLFVSERFQKVRHGLLTHKWLGNYQYPHGYLNAFKQIEMRLNGRVKFASEAEKFLKTHNASIKRGFEEFYPHLSLYALKLAT